MESWNHSFKVEAVHGERFKTRTDAKYQVFEYIEVYYNRKRLHSKLLIRPVEDLTSVRLEPVERLMCFDSLSTNGSNIIRPNQ